MGFKIKASHSDSIKFLDINLANKLGLAAGLDKNGDYIDCL